MIVVLGVYGWSSPREGGFDESAGPTSAGHKSGEELC